MRNLKFFMTALVLYAAVMWKAADMSAQTISLNIGSYEEKEKKEESKEKPVEKPAEKSSPSLEYQLKLIFGVKSETSLEDPRVENIGKYFLDKYTGQVTLISYYKGDPVRWDILRDNVPDDYVHNKEAVNYQLIKYGDNSDNLILVNLNSGVMWAIDIKGLSYKNTRLVYIPITDIVR